MDPSTAPYAVVTGAGCLIYGPETASFVSCPDAAGRRCGRLDPCPHGVVLAPPCPN